MSVELKVPSAGESITEVHVGAWMKSVGDAVERDEVLVEIETDKASMELPAPVSGTLHQILKPSGQSAAVGEVIALIEENGAAGDRQARDAAASGAPSVQRAAEESATPAAASKRGFEAQESARVMPAARAALARHGLSAGDVQATGPGGRLLKEDVEREAARRNADSAPRTAPAPAPPAPAAAPPARSGPIGAGGSPSAKPRFSGAARQEEVVPMTLLRRRIAERLVQAQQTAAMLTTFNEVDLSAVMALRSQFKETFEQQHGVKLGFMSFFVKAAIDALKREPAINAEIRGDSIVYKNYFDIGVAVSTDRGLVVPVLRSAERLSFAEIEAAIADFSLRARDRKIAPDELQGGTFTISNGGVFGSLLSTPILNPPQSGILGLHAIQERPVAVGGQVVVRPMMYVALTYDHRIVDGREAVTFLRRIKECIEQPARMLVEV